MTMEIPSGPFVALYGSIAGDWRTEPVASLNQAGVEWFDPTNAGWDVINSTNGDTLQTEVDALVARELEGLRRAKCVVFYLAWRRREGGVETGTTLSFAARCEFGWLIGSGIQTFFHIESDVEGRNYLWAAARGYQHMVRCESLDAAVMRAVAYTHAAPML